MLFQTWHLELLHPKESFFLFYRVNLVKQKRGSYECDNLRCQVCNSIEAINTFTSTVSRKSLKKQYTGKTVDRFKLRWKNCKKSNKKLLRCREIKQNSLHKDFLRDGHQSYEKDVSVCLIENTTLLTIMRGSIIGWGLLKQ